MGKDPGYPEVWSIFSTMEEDNIAKPIFDQITDLQNRYLPGVIMAEDFESAWAEYVKRYENVNYVHWKKKLNVKSASAWLSINKPALPE